MSAITPSVPYVAPWVTAFNRYAVQLSSGVVASPTARTWKIPTGQWWRIVYVYGIATTDANAGTRSLKLAFQFPAGTTKWDSYAPQTIDASSEIEATWATNGTSYAVTYSTAHVYCASSLPDLIWGPGSQITVTLENFQATDAIAAATNLSYEMYTEEYPGALTPSPPVETPLLT